MSRYRLIDSVHTSGQCLTDIQFFAQEIWLGQLSYMYRCMYV